MELLGRCGREGRGMQRTPLVITTMAFLAVGGPFPVVNNVTSIKPGPGGAGNVSASLATVMARPLLNSPRGSPGNKRAQQA